MPRPRVYIESNGVYELCLRARQNLPFPCRKLIALCIKSTIARAQRDAKVTLCHMLWMNNHVHLLIVAHDAAQCVKFYMELQRKLTEYLKRLLGLRKLNLFEGDAHPIRIADLEAATERISYFYANPAAADLEDSISRYPGVSSWSAFLALKQNLHGTSSEDVPWIRPATVTKAPRRDLTPTQDTFLAQRLTQRALTSHPLELKPNAWMPCFGVTTEQEVAQINEHILTQIAAREAEHRAVRQKEGKKVIGAYKLSNQPLMLPHTPKERSPKVRVIAACNTLRAQYLELLKDIAERCAQCYQRWKQGDFSVRWPPGTFPPAPPVQASALA